jgi:hypothetical protein
MMIHDLWGLGARGRRGRAPRSRPFSTSPGVHSSGPVASTDRRETTGLWEVERHRAHRFQLPPEITGQAVSGSGQVL